MRCGFTIIQLALCVLLMMAAMVFLIPALKQQLGAAGAVACQENLDAIYRSLSFYREDNDLWWPERQVRTQAGLIRDSNVWVGLLLDGQYVEDVSTFICPEDPNAPQRDSMTQEFLRRQVSQAPSYGLNQLTWREYGVAPSDDPGIRREPASVLRTILLADMGPDFARSDLPTDPAEQRRIIESARDAGRLVPDDGFRIGPVRPPPSWLTPRHGRRINLMAMRGRSARSHEVTPMMKQPPKLYYDDCAIGDCTFCNVFRAPHYDFSSAELYWWTGPYATEAAEPASAGP